MRRNTLRNFTQDMLRQSRDVYPVETDEPSFDKLRTSQKAHKPQKFLGCGWFIMPRRGTKNSSPYNAPEAHKPHSATYIFNPNSIITIIFFCDFCAFCGYHQKIRIGVLATPWAWFSCLFVAKMDLLQLRMISA